MHPDAIETAVQSVLMLEIFDKNNNEIATGSGFLMFDNMTLITNYHVIENASTIIADSDDGYQYFVTKVLIAKQSKRHCYSGSSCTPTIMQPLEYSTDSIKRGGSIAAIGSPIGLKNTVSLGNVSSVYNEDWCKLDSVYRAYFSREQRRCAIEPQRSGYRHHQCFLY